MPSVTHGLYGNRLTQQNCSLEHLLPRSQRGGTTFSNLALATREANMVRGSKPLSSFLTWEMLEAYLSQFNFRILGVFDGFLYQNQVRRTCERLGVQSRENPLKHLPKKLARSLRNKARKAGFVPKWLDNSPKMEQMEFPFMKELDFKA